MIKNKIKATTKCSRCGATISKVFTEYGIQEIATKKAEREKSEWQAKPHLCRNCMRKEYDEKGKDITKSLKGDFNNLINLEKHLNEFVEAVTQEQGYICDKLFRKIEGKVVRAVGREWVVRTVGANPLITCSGIDKVRPWFSSRFELRVRCNTPGKSYNWGDVYECDITDVVITNENFAERALIVKD